MQTQQPNTNPNPTNFESLPLQISSLYNTNLIPPTTWTSWPPQLPNTNPKSSIFLLPTIFFTSSIQTHPWNPRDQNSSPKQRPRLKNLNCTNSPKYSNRFVQALFFHITCTSRKQWEWERDLWQHVATLAASYASSK